MARTVEVTKVGVSSSQAGLAVITLKLKYLDGVTELISRDFSKNYKKGQAPSTVINRFREEMQEAIDLYKEAELISNHAQMASAITNLKNSLEV